jgi:hypothetical protein
LTSIFNEKRVQKSDFGFGEAAFIKSNRAKINFLI